MNAERNGLPLKIGLLIVSLSWFLFTFFEFAKAAFNIGQVGFWVPFTDTAGVVGLGLRTAAGLIAVVTVLFYLFRKDLSRPEALMSLRWIVLLEAANFLSLLPSGIWGTTGINSRFGLGFLIETGLPCLLESIAIPIVLVKLFFELNPNKPAKGAIKWGLIAGTVYIFVFWFNNSSNWIFEVMQDGTQYVTSYPANILSFGVTTVGLLVLGIYAAYFTKKYASATNEIQPDLRKVGAIITALGTYFLGIYVMWMFLDSVGGWSEWYAWFFGHNVDLWVMAIPLVGLPLLLQQKKKTEKINLT